MALANYSTISGDFASYLTNERQRVLPFVGAGISVDAGVPAADALADSLAERAREEGVTIGDGATFADVCHAVSDQLSHGRLQEITAAAVDEFPLRPTPLQRLIVRCPLGVVLTSNFEASIEMAARDAGLEPLPRTPDQARALERPDEGQVVIVYLHGRTSEPESMALPGDSLDALREDERFKTTLRGLVAPHAVVYLGYRLPPEDAYLRSEIELLASMFTDRGPHALLIPKSEYEDRQEKLEPLLELGVRVETFDSTLGYEAVHQAALIIAPSNTVEGRDRLAIVRDTDKATHYLAPVLLPEDRERDDTEPDTRLIAAQLGFGEERIAGPSDVIASRRSVILGEPGMGKTQFLYHLGVSETERVPLIAKLTTFAGEMLEPDEPERLLTAVLSSARSFETDTSAPTRDSLDGNAYLLLFDALDEVAEERRHGVVAALASIADRYPQHAIVVSSRINAAAATLEDAGFTLFRIPRDPEWGNRFLRERGIPDPRVEQLYAEAHTIADLLAVPQYASLIADRLADEANRPLPATAFELITEVGVRDVVAREAVHLGYSADEIYRWLRTLAVSLELRGRVWATADEVVAIPAPGELRAPETRERLVERALLQDLPDKAALQTNTVQEALAAEALLATEDPIATLQEATIATLLGSPVFRADLDHAIDLFYEGAPPDLRPALRELDELRWARTIRADAPGEELSDALDTLWRIYLERRVWIDRNPGREIRDARSAVERLVIASPDIARERRDTWIAATKDAEPTTRANAAFFLQQLGFDADTPGWLEPLLRDQNNVVRRQAAVVATSLRDEERTLLPVLEEVYPGETDELAAETFGYSIFEIAGPDDASRVLRLLIENPLGWGRLSHLLSNVSLDDALAVLRETGIRSGEDERLLGQIVAAAPSDTWTDEQTQRLVALLVQGGRLLFYGEFKEEERLEEIVRIHPEAALAGARQGAGATTEWSDVYFLRVLPREDLVAASEGALDGPLKAVIHMLDVQAREVELPEAQPARAQEEPSLRIWLAEGQLEENARQGRIPRPLLDGFVGEVEQLDGDERTRLAEVTARLWPEAPLRDHLHIEGSHGTCSVLLPIALAFSAALDEPLDPDRWLEIFESGALWFRWSAAEWLRRHYPAEREGEVAASISGFGDELQVKLALDAIPVLSDQLAEAVADALSTVDDGNAVSILERLREEGKFEALSRLAAEARSPVIARNAHRQLARAGDVAAQRAELAMMRTDLEANPNAYGWDDLPWSGEARPEVIDELAALLRQDIEGGPRAEMRLDRAIQTALAATRDERALAVYDDLIADRGLDAGSFLRYQRDQLAREFAREQILERLPVALEEVAIWMIGRGLPVE